MIILFIQRDRDEYFVIRDDGASQATHSGPWHDTQAAQVQAENAAHALAAQTGGDAIWTVKPDDVAEREYEMTGERGSRSAWIIR